MRRSDPQNFFCGVLHLYRCAYLVREGYDVQKQMNQSIGFDERNRLFDELVQAVQKYKPEHRGRNITINLNGCVINLDTINTIVTKNQDRKISGLPFYPFERNIDKYNSCYISAFTNGEADEKLKADGVINELLEAIGPGYKILNLKIRTPFEM